MLQILHSEYKVVSSLARDYCTNNTLSVSLYIRLGLRYTNDESSSLFCLSDTTTILIKTLLKTVDENK